MALTYPPSTSVKHGLAWPPFGSSPTDLVTTAPHPHPIIRTRDGPVSSMMPEATMPGLSSSSAPTRVFSDAMAVMMLGPAIKLARWRPRAYYG